MTLLLLLDNLFLYLLSHLLSPSLFLIRHYLPSFDIMPILFSLFVHLWRSLLFLKELLLLLFIKMILSLLWNHHVVPLFELILISQRYALVLLFSLSTVLHLMQRHFGLQFYRGHLLLDAVLQIAYINESGVDWVSDLFSCLLYILLVDLLSLPIGVHVLNDLAVDVLGLIQSSLSAALLISSQVILE